MKSQYLTVLTTTVVLMGFAIPAPVRAQQLEVATTVAFTEGPAVDRDGNVYFTEMVTQRIMKLSPKGVLSTFREHSNNANGLLIDPQGRLVACEGAESQRTGVLIRNSSRRSRGPTCARARWRCSPTTIRASRSSARTTSRSTAKAGCTSPI